MFKDGERRRLYEAELGLRPNPGEGFEEIKLPNPGIGWTWIVDMLIRILAALLPILTPTIREELERFLLAWYAKAMETTNPWDDFLARFLLRILQIPIPA